MQFISTDICKTNTLFYMLLKRQINLSSVVAWQKEGQLYHRVTTAISIFASWWESILYQNVYGQQNISINLLPVWFSSFISMFWIINLILVTSLTFFFKDFI